MKIERKQRSFILTRKNIYTERGKSVPVIVCSLHPDKQQFVSGILT